MTVPGSDVICDLHGNGVRVSGGASDELATLQPAWRRRCFPPVGRSTRQAFEQFTEVTTY